MRSGSAVATPAFLLALSNVSLSDNSGITHTVHDGDQHGSEDVAPRSSGLLALAHELECTPCTDRWMHAAYNCAPCTKTFCNVLNCAKSAPDISDDDDHPKTSKIK